MIEKIIIPTALVIVSGLSEKNIGRYECFPNFNSAENSKNLVRRTILPENITTNKIKPTRDEIMENVIDIVVDKLGLARSKVKPNSSYTNDLGADSLDVVELIMEFEKNFCIAIPDDKAEKLSTIAQSVDFIYDKVNSTPVIFYFELNFGGNKERFYCDGAVLHLGKAIEYNSLIVPKGHVVTLYNEIDYGGVSIKIDASKNEMKIKSVNNLKAEKSIIFSTKIIGKFEIKSFKVVKLETRD